MEKSLFQSKTFWANIIALGATVATAFGFEITEEQQGTLIAGVMTVVNIVLRMVTNTGIRR